VTRVCGLVVNDAGAERLAGLLASLPAVGSGSGRHAHTELLLCPRLGAGAAAAEALLVGAARAVGRCSRLRSLILLVDQDVQPADQLPATFWQRLADARALEDLKLFTLSSCSADARGAPSTASASRMMAGLAGLSQLRALDLTAHGPCEHVTLPACFSRLVQLTSLSLCGLRGLRFAPGWARLPALEFLEFEDCEFAGGSEDALPGMVALAALTSLQLWDCPSLRVLPAALWRLTRLRSLAHDTRTWCSLPRGALPVAGPLAAGAPWLASLTHLTLAGLNLPVFPPGALAATRLAHLDLSQCSFERLPSGVSALTALTALHLGRHAPGPAEVGGTFDARALGGLAGFPKLQRLRFGNCSVLFCSDLGAAAAHPRLERLEVVAAYPAPGPSCRAFLGLTVALLQQGRPDAIELRDCAVQGAGQVESDSFLAALDAVGYLPAEHQRALLAAGYT